MPAIEFVAFIEENGINTPLILTWSSVRDGTNTGKARREHMFSSLHETGQARSNRSLWLIWSNESGVASPFERL